MRDRPDRTRAWVLPALATLALVLAVASQIDMFDPRFYLAGFDAGIPGWNVAWPYPPLAALPAAGTLLDPRDPNRAMVLFVTVPCTLATLVMLWRARGPSNVAAVAFMALSMALLAVSYANRLEPLSVTLAVAGLLALRVGRHAIAGVLLGLGGLVKAWPLTLVFGAATWRRWRTVATAALTWTAIAAAALLLGGTQAWSWLAFASARGIEAEAISALPGLWARAIGAPGYDVGLDDVTASVVIDGPWLAASKWMTAAVVAAVVIVVTVRTRDQLGVQTWTQTHARHAFLIVVGVLLALPVLSPQFITWPLAAVAVALIDGWLRRTAVVWMVVCGLTTIVFPVLFVPLMYEDRLAPLIILTVRDVLMIGVFAATAWRLWRQAKTAA